MGQTTFSDRSAAPPLPATARVLGIDVGGTKTHAALAGGGAVLVDTVVPSKGWQFSDFETRARELAALVARLAQEGGAPDAVVVGAHGCDSAEHCVWLWERLQPLVPAPLAVVNDAELLLPAAGLYRGIGVVAGTGSIAVGYDSADHMLVVGGWGWLFGDEGSAAGLVREAARAVMAAYDRGEADDTLTKALLEVFSAQDVPALSGAMARARGASEWAQHAPRIFEVAASGASTRAEQVIADGGRALAGLVEQLAARGADASAVALGGGVITSQPPLQQAFAQAFAASRPDTTIIIVEQPPVVGALVLAEQLLNPNTPYAAVRRSPAWRMS